MLVLWRRRPHVEAVSVYRGTEQLRMRLLDLRSRKTRRYKVVPVGARGCQTVPKGARRCQMVPEGARWCQRVPESAKRCQSVPESAR